MYNREDRLDKTFDGENLGLGGDLDSEIARGLRGDGPDGGHRDAAQRVGSGGFAPDCARWRNW